MPSVRRRDLLSRRRRVDDDGEDEASTAGGQPDESQSEASLPSDDDADADDSDLSETDAPDPSAHSEQKRPKKPRKRGKTGKSSKETEDESSPQQSNDVPFIAPSDTTAMLDGLKGPIAETGGEALDFDTLGKDLPQQPVVIRSEAGMSENSKNESPAERRRREHEDYKKKRDADPAFIPNRGAFFMHDHRSSGPGQNGFRPFGRGRGRGIGVGGPLPFAPAPVSEPTSNPWTHDLHESLLEPDRSTRSGAPNANQQGSTTSAATNIGPPSNPRALYSTTVNPAVAASSVSAAVEPARSFSVTKALHSATGRILLPGMKDAKPFTVSIKIYARLPNHRPPLRRDKPVRISLPEHAPRYIFPAIDRSFIFIPRALRPNQQGFGRGRGRGLGSMTGFSSRRTSLYGGSINSPSIAMSRRSSINRDFSRDALTSPSGSVMAGGRPVVRLPPGSQIHSGAGTPLLMSGAGTPVTAMPPYGFPPPQKSIPANMQMYQPSPRKTVSVAGIESPSAASYRGMSQQDQVPFHQQMPQHLNGSAAQAPSFFPGGRPYPPQPSSGTPLSNIPERAIHAQSFQPYQNPGFQQPMYYYPPTTTGQPQYGSGAVIAPLFVPQGQQGAGYIMPTIAPAAPSNIPAQSQQAMANQPQMVAYEQNGMVYYYDPSQMQQMPGESYSNSAYTMPGVGGMMTPAPDGYYYPQMAPAPVYYPTQ